MSDNFVPVNLLLSGNGVFVNIADRDLPGFHWTERIGRWSGPAVSTIQSGSYPPNILVQKADYPGMR